MINQNFFLKEDEHKAKMENDCILRCLGMAEAHYKKGNYVESSAYYVNAAHSLEVLENLKQRKLEQKNNSCSNTSK